MSLTREAVLRASKKPRVQKVSTPELGEDGHLYVKVLNAAEFFAQQKLDRELRAAGKQKLDDGESAMMSFCVMAICDDKGSRIFRDSDARKLGELPVVVLKRCLEAIMALNALGDDEDRAGN